MNPGFSQFPDFLVKPGLALKTEVSEEILKWHSHSFSLTPAKSSRIYTGQYTFQILLLNDDNMLGEHKEREKNV